MTDSVPEAELKETDAGLVPEGEGWFVLNARDVTWIRSEDRGQDTTSRAGRSGPSSASALRFSLPASHGPATTASSARRTSSSFRASACS